MVANAWLEGTYTERFPHVTRDAAGMGRLFRQFSFPGGIPSHCGPETPGSIHEGGELGYSLSHAFGAAFDNLGLVVACVVGDGEAETGPAAAGWHSNKFLDPRRDGAVLPILHLNGYKIAAPTVLARIPAAELLDLFSGYGYHPLVVEGGFDDEDHMAVHRRLATALDAALAEIDEIWDSARSRGLDGSAEVADADPADAQGLDRAQDGRRSDDRGDLPGPPDPRSRRPDQPRAPRPARRLAPQLPPRRALRPRRAAGRAGSCGSLPAGTAG